MDILVIFWMNSDNFEDVIKRDYSITREDQIRQYEIEKGWPEGDAFAIDRTIED
jgi:hypothetical protein